MLNQLTTATTLTSKAARYRHAARGRAVADFAFRRTQGVDSAIMLVRAVAISGLAGTSNVAGGRRYGVPLAGTMAHSFVQAHEDEMAAFQAFAELFGSRSILRVDTYDTHGGVEKAIDVARALRANGRELQGIRLDSGELADLARHARRRLDEAGFSQVQIVVSGGLDEHVIEAIVEAGAPIDAFGVGSDLGVSADAPVLDTVYKLVTFDGRPVRKLSSGKETSPGAKQVWRRADWFGDVLGLREEPAPEPGAEPLLVDVMRDVDRDATIDRCYEVTDATLHAVFDQLHRQRVSFEHMILKPNMVISGKDCPDQAGVDEVAEETSRSSVATCRGRARCDLPVGRADA